MALFDVLGSNLAIAGIGTNPPIYFKVDVASIYPTGAVKTGIVEATLVAGGVPEPAAWACMLIGFGGLGTILRRRRAMMAALA